MYLARFLDRLICRFKGHDKHWNDDLTMVCSRCGHTTQYEVRG
jgi:hypothetical protein